MIFSTLLFNPFTTWGGSKTRLIHLKMNMILSHILISDKKKPNTFLLYNFIQFKYSLFSSKLKLHSLFCPWGSICFALIKIYYYRPPSVICFVVFLFHFSLLRECNDFVIVWSYHRQIKEDLTKRRIHNLVSLFFSNMNLNKQK